MKIWRHGIIWFSVLIICLALWSFNSALSKKEKSVFVSPRIYEKSRPLGLPPVAMIEPKTDWADVGLKIGSGLGGFMTLVNLIEKFVKMFRKKEE